MRALEKIPSRAFVTTYTGEIITDKEAERRGTIYDFMGRTYLFDIDGAFDEDYDDINYIGGGNCDGFDRFTIDAYHYGNISHFINHSCEPNLTVYACFIDNQDPRCHEVALFANRDIQIGEPLSFDYTGGNINESEGATYVECFCGAKNCRKLVAM